MTHKLYYFDSRGFGEPIRILFKLAGEGFEDVRIDLADWPNHREDMPYGSMPVLEVKGLKIPQSAAIARYVAHKFGLAGKTPEEEAWADALVDWFKDYYSQITDWYYTAFGLLDKSDVGELYKAVFVPTRDQAFGLLNDRLKSQGSKFLIGDSVTWADIFWTEHMSSIEIVKPDAFEGFPEVVALKKRVDEIPRIKAYLEERPPVKMHTREESKKTLSLK